MTGLAVLTPSYAPDLELCRDLNRSVLAWTTADHHIVVPRRDRGLFAPLAGPRTHLWTVDDLLPRRMVPVPRANVWVNVRRPVPPVRGWVMQQVIKLRAAEVLDADVLLLVDSDVLLVRPVTAETFRRDGRVRFYRQDAAVDAALPRHLRWHEVARRLLALPPADPPLPDYVSAFAAWDRRVVLALLRRIERVTGRPWLDAVAGELHVSEFILYGVFVDAVLADGAGADPVGSTLCHSYWDPAPLDGPAARAFVAGLPPDDVAVMISAKSGTPLDVRRAALCVSNERHFRSN